MVQEGLETPKKGPKIRFYGFGQLVYCIFIFILFLYHIYIFLLECNGLNVNTMRTKSFLRIQVSIRQNQPKYWSQEVEEVDFLPT